MKDNSIMIKEWHGLGTSLEQSNDNGILEYNTFSLTYLHPHIHGACIGWYGESTDMAFFWHPNVLKTWHKLSQLHPTWRTAVLESTDRWYKVLYFILWESWRSVTLIFQLRIELVNLVNSPFIYSEIVTPLEYIVLLYNLDIHEYAQTEGNYRTIVH